MSRAARAFVADLQRVAPIKKPNPLSLANTRGFAELSDKRRIQARDVAALHAMQAARPLKPPPMVHLPARVSAGALALHRDKKLGVYEEPRR